MLDEQRVDRDPVAGVYGRAEALLGLLRGRRAHDPEAVGDPVDVGVDGDRRDPVAEDEDAVRGLRPDAGQREQRLVVPGHRSPVLLEDRPRARADDPALRPVEADRPHDRLEHPRVGSGERPRVREPCEEPGARDVGVRVARPLGEDRPDEHLERVLGVVAQVRPAPVPGAVERREPVEQELPVERPRLPRAGHGCSGGGPWPGSLRSGSSVAPSSRRSSPTR